MQYKKSNIWSLRRCAELALWGLLAPALLAKPALAQGGTVATLLGIQSWLAGNLPWAVTGFLSLIIAWGFGYLMFLMLFSGMKQHGPIAARIGVWFAACVLFLLVAFFVLPVYFGIHFVLWHWVLATALLLILFFICYATAPKAPKVGT